LLLTAAEFADLDDGQRVLELESAAARALGLQTDELLVQTLEPQRPRADLPPARVGRAVALVARDLDPGGAPGIELTVEPDLGDSEAWMVFAHAKERSAGSGFLLDGRFSNLVATIADLVQEQVIDLIWSEWPRCPYHGHPLGARSDDDTAWWACPMQPESHWAIGTLGGDRAYLAATRSRQQLA
jgi:hypothetical protein